MRIEQITIANFLSFGPEQSLDLGHAGLVLIEGDNRDDQLAASNGSGKSAFIEALYWGLCGKTLRGLRGDDVIHRATGKGTRVVLTGMHDDKPWTIVRSRKLAGHGGLTFTFAGADLTAAGDQNETQRRIAKIFGVDAGLIASTLIFGQGAAGRFSAMNDAERKALLDRLLGVEIIDIAHRVAAQDKFIKANELRNLETDLASHRDRLRLLRGNRNALRQARLATQAAHVEGLMASAKTIRTRLDSAVKAPPHVEDISGKVSEARTALRAANEATRAHRDKVTRAYTRLHAVQVAHRQHERDRPRAAGTPCRTCGEKLSEASAEAQAKRFEARKRKLDARLAKAVSRHDRVAKRLAKSDRGVGALQAAYDAVVARERRYAVDMAAYEGERRRREELEAELARVEALLAAPSKNVRSPAERDLSRQIKTIRVEARQKKNDAKSLAKELAHIDFWCKGFGPGGIKSHLLDHVVPTLDAYAARFARHLMAGLTVTFSTQGVLKGGAVRDKFEAHVKDVNGVPVYLGASSGERRKVDIVIALTLQALERARASSLGANVCVWDEVFESLDETSAEAVMTLLQAEAKGCETVFVVTHQAWLKSYFPRTLRVTKENGTSRLAWAR